MSGEAWSQDCLHWRGRVLLGKNWHWCPDWDYLPIDETCPEWPCACDNPEQKWPPNPCAIVEGK